MTASKEFHTEQGKSLVSCDSGRSIWCYQGSEISTPATATAGIQDPASKRTGVNSKAAPKSPNPTSFVNFPANEFAIGLESPGARLVRAGVDTCIWACGLLFLAFWGFMTGIVIVTSNWDLGTSIYERARSRVTN